MNTPCHLAHNYITPTKSFTVPKRTAEKMRATYREWEGRGNKKESVLVA